MNYFASKLYDVRLAVSENLTQIIDNIDYWRRFCCFVDADAFARNSTTVYKLRSTARLNRKQTNLYLQQNDRPRHASPSDRYYISVKPSDIFGPPGISGKLLGRRPVVTKMQRAIKRRTTGFPHWPRSVRASCLKIKCILAPSRETRPS